MANSHAMDSMSGLQACAITTTAHSVLSPTMIRQGDNVRWPTAKKPDSKETT